MKKRTLLIAITMALLLLSIVLILAACGSVKGTYYEVSGDNLNESSWIKLSGGKWTDDENTSGTYKKNGNNVTFFVDGEELCSGTAKDGTLELKMFGSSLGIFRTKKAHEKYLKLLKKEPSKAVTYTITLDPGEGTLNSGNTVTVEGNSSYTLPVPTRFAYTFTGWYLGDTKVSDAEGNSIGNWTYTSDRTFTARWEQTRYTSTVDENVDGVSDTPDIATFYYGTSVTASVTEKSGYTWLGWFAGDTKVSESYNYTFTMPAQDVYYTAKWITCPITLTKNIEAAGRVDGIADATVAGESTTITAKVYAGYVWEGWFDGDTKVSEGESLTYTFNMPTERKTYTAKFAECTDHTFNDGCVCTKCNAVAHTPDANGYCEKCGFKREGNYVYFGSYPQTIKSNGVDITSTTDARGYYLGTDGEYYAQVIAKPNGYGYTFSNGTTITNNSVYYFKVEPIKWRILSEEGGEALILCESIIDCHVYSGTSNNYALSAMREWLNGTFYDTAFKTLQKNLIILTTVDNSVRSTNPNEEAYRFRTTNRYVCEDTLDNVFLLSEQEVTNNNYGFSSDPNSESNSRQKIHTDYALSQGVATYSGWLLRSPENGSNSRAYYVNRSGYSNGTQMLSRKEYCGVVPAIKIKL